MGENYGCIVPIVVAVFLFILCSLMMFGVNSFSSEKWNDGICFNCKARYELKGVSDALKYYTCPECGQEVNRY